MAPRLASPRPFAEVTLVMERMGVALPAHLLSLDRGEEISVTRRLFRDGTAEYLINKTQVRLKDVHEVFMDTGVGRRAYSIIEQGQVDRMINVKPEDRRVIFEEVAGVTKYRAKRKEAERKLEATALNISRVQDVLNELEKQLRSLKIQSTRARKYKELKIELESIDLFLLGRNLFKLKNSIDELKTQSQSFIERRSVLDAQFSTVDAEITELDIARIDQEKNSNELDEKERELTLRVQRLENQLVVFAEQKKTHR